MISTASSEHGEKLATKIAEPTRGLPEQKSLPAPHLTTGPGYYAVCWDLGDVVVEMCADRLHEHSDGRTTARVKVTVTNQQGKSVCLSESCLNVMSMRARRELALTLEERKPLEAAPWDELLEVAFQRILAARDQGEPVAQLNFVDTVEPDFLLAPLLIKGMPTVIYGPGGAGKSLLLLLVGIAVQNGLGGSLQSEVEPANVLLLDWEMSWEETSRRATLLARGLSRTHAGRTMKLPLYRRCVRPLADTVGEIAKVISERNIRLLVIDSLAPAASGDLIEAGAVIRFFESVRQAAAATQAAALIGAHVNRADRRQEDKARLPYGSIFVENLSRLTWEVRHREDPQKKILTVGLHCRKSNFGPQDPLGYRFTFGREAILASPAEVSDDTVAGSTQSLLLSELEAGPMQIGELAKILGLSSNATQLAVNRLLQRGLVKRVARGTYAAVSKEAAP